MRSRRARRFRSPLPLARILRARMQAADSAFGGNTAA